MAIFSYVVARDFGFAPNPFFSYCTLATCKPVIRKCAAIGDWIIGTGSGPRANHLVFAMRVSEILSFNDYWDDARFDAKKPFMLGSKKQAYGDNIYFKRRGTRKWQQENSHHSNKDGTPNQRNIGHDTQVDRVLVSSKFVYFGGEGPPIPAHISSTLCKRGPGHKCRFTGQFEQSVVSWVQSLGLTGFAGQPLDWADKP